MNSPVSNLQIQHSFTNYNTNLYECALREECRAAAVEMLADWSNKYHWTITFRDGFSDEFYHQSFNHLLMQLNQLLFPRRQVHRDVFSCIRGFAMRERGKKGALHFHCIIRDQYNDLESKRSFQQALDIAIPRITYGPKLYDVNTGKWHAKRLIGRRHGSLLDPYFNYGSSALEKYVTKQFDDMGFGTDYCLDCIGLLGQGGAIFGDIYIK